MKVSRTESNKPGCPDVMIMVLRPYFWTLQYLHGLFMQG